MSRKQKRITAGIIKGIIFTLVCLFFIAPYLWMVLISLKPRVDIFEPGKFIFTPTLQNYDNIIKNAHILDYFKNSVIVSVISTAISLVIGSFAAYGFARFHWKNRENTAFMVLSQRMLPSMAIVIPYFLMAMAGRLLDTKIILIICYLLFNIPFTILMMRGFFEDIPVEIEDAGKIDGCSGFQVLKELVLPLSLPGLTATAIFCLINSWNEFVFANFLTSVRAKTVPTSVMLFLSVSGTKWGEMAATGVLSSLPVIIFGIAVQKYMIRGLTFGAVKG
ncbi:carbohydrate ABC transporter permease [Lacrimispora sp. 210928-DFI.3.58]|uniref:carbohydrate ABC transporter permease n=1 Tax=Lacrimispora sp. 210928-DFI.3.58 TaxID=2883214 RepID=UPI0015B7784B|nr:carbohydrate ABC transporter permease [Lacrimispora sp. 210928-DFI.3.58]MCB7319201.1 carbohydrate ABC transporter permease [Lacrimispora sp. 210928-DFI.3.58]